MAVIVATGNNGIFTQEAESPLLTGVVVDGFVNSDGCPSMRSKSGGWRSAFFILAVESAERLSYFAIQSNLITYLSGPMGLSTASAAVNVSVWTGIGNISPLLGAFIADAYLGRYRTIIVASILYIVALGILSLSAALQTANCKNVVSSGACSPLLLQAILFYFSLYSVAFIQAGHRPCLQAFGADQFDGEDEKECLAKASFFNWWNFCMSISVLLAQLILNYIQENLSWELGFGIPAIGMLVALLVFLLGSITYRFPINSDGRNPFTRIGLVFAKAVRNWRSAPTVLYVAGEPTLHHEGTQFKFLNKALITPNGSGEGNVCSTGDVDDAKAILRLVPIWCTCLGYAIVFPQSNTLFTKQGATLDRYITSSLQLPAASFQSLITLTLLVFLPIYDRILVPISRSITKKLGGITMLQRIGAGLALSIIAMVIAAFVERKRLATAIEYGLVDTPEATIPMSIWWLAPQYMILGVSDACTIVGLQEFFYDQIPKELKSVGSALFLSVFGIGSFLNSFLISTIEEATSGNDRDGWFSDNLNRAHVDYYYWLLAGFAVVSFGLYVHFSKSYVYYNRKNYL